jgi:hypothetical protein
MNAITTEPGVIALTRAEGRKVLGERTRRILGMSLAEFERRYDTGTLDLDNPDVFSLVMQLPLAR